MPEQKILLVEDQKTPMRVLRDALKKQGYDVIVVTTAFDALDELNMEGAHGVIAAVKLPDMTGCELSALLRSSRATETLPIILVAEKGDEKDFWFRAAQPSAVVDYREVEFDEAKTLTTLKKLLDEAAKKAPPFDKVDDSAVVSGEYSGSDLIRSQRNLISGLLVDRAVATYCRGLIESMDDRVEFMRRFFTFLEKTFQADLIGLIFNDPVAPWGMYQVKPTVARSSFEENVLNAAKIVEMRANQRMIVSCDLQEKGTEVKVTEVLCIRMGGPQVVGALLLGWPTGQGDLDDLSKETLGQLKLHMQSVMRVLQHRQEVQALQQQQQYWSSTDQITGLYNLEFLMGFLNQQLLFSNRHGLPVGVIIVDVDNFLQFNTNLGTEIGDRVLQNVAQKLSTIVRSSDLVARYAGDQFAVVLPNSDLEGAKLVGEKLRAGVESLQVPGVNGGYKVTISVGCAEFDKTRDINPETVLRDAKLALGRAKEKGRNCVAG